MNIPTPITDSKLIVKGRRIKIGKTICTTEATATNQDGEIVANGTSKLVIYRDMPVIQQAFNAFSSETLPPKFIKNNSI